jgi:hypothetical protein
MSSKTKALDCFVLGIITLRYDDPPWFGVERWVIESMVRRHTSFSPYDVKSSLRRLKKKRLVIATGSGNFWRWQPAGVVRIAY